MWHSVEVDSATPEPPGLPDFRIPHAEKIQWMIETTGWALERGARFCYTIGIAANHGFPEIAVSGLTPVAVKGLVDLVVEQLDGGVEIPLDVPLMGLLDNDLRCVFATVDVSMHTEHFATGIAWNRGAAFPCVQLMWPDRAGLLPFESGCDARTVAVQSIIGRLPGRED